MAAIQTLGQSNHPIIEFCTIKENLCPAIQVCLGNSCSIRKNTLICNDVGIEVISGDPHITKNVISRNLNDGILTMTVDDLACVPRIYFNNINSNRGNGINCKGKKNHSRIGILFFSYKIRVK